MTVFIMGSRGYRRNYGGWETLVKNLIKNWNDESTKFYVFEVSNYSNDVIIYDDGVIAPQIKCPNIGNATMVYFSYEALKRAIQTVKKEKISDAIFYVLGLRIGTIFKLYRKRLLKLGIKVVINPDGLEWRRAKWNFLVKKYFKLSEKHMIQNSDAIICDSYGIKKYIDLKYRNYASITSYASYGTYIKDITLSSPEQVDFFNKHNIVNDEYYLIVGRFVPENNYELIISEFMKSITRKDLVIISNNQGNPYFEKLKSVTGFDNDKRVKFVGTVYNQDLLHILRSKAYAYIHGHSAGGTNPSLLEAMSTTKVILAYDVEFNREVLGEKGLFFKNNANELKLLIEQTDTLCSDKINMIGELYKKRAVELYSWNSVVRSTISVFENVLKR